MLPQGVVPRILLLTTVVGVGVLGYALGQRHATKAAATAQPSSAGPRRSTGPSPLLPDVPRFVVPTPPEAPAQPAAVGAPSAPARTFNPDRRGPSEEQRAAAQKLQAEIDRIVDSEVTRLKTEDDVRAFLATSAARAREKRELPATLVIPAQLALARIEDPERRNQLTAEFEAELGRVRDAITAQQPRPPIPSAADIARADAQARPELIERYRAHAHSLPPAETDRLLRELDQALAQP